MASNFQYIIVFAMATLLIIPSYTQLTPNFYDQVCPQALPTINSVVKQAINREPRMGASLLRLHFHDCFVNGCDGSILLDDTANFTGEKSAPPNLSIRGFNVIDEIKEAVDKACNCSVVSCADILAVAARDSVSILGGPQYWYEVLLGRRDSRSAEENATTNIPAPFSNFSQLLSNFESHGLNVKNLVALSGAHTIGYAHCSSFKDRIFNDTNIDPNFAFPLKGKCLIRLPCFDFERIHVHSNVTESSFKKLDPRLKPYYNRFPIPYTCLVPLDYATPTKFDTEYYKALLSERGLLHSDQELFKGDGSESDTLVRLYSNDPFAFARDFKASMIKMGNLKPLTGTAQEVRINCRRVN